MSTQDPVELLFGGMQKLGPGGDADTLHVLRSLPQKSFDVVVDAGCGAGRQTIALAKELRTTIHAIDSHQPFLDELTLRAEQAGVASLVEAHCMDMSGIPERFSDVDLLWSEGAAYNIGFENALILWAKALRSGGFAAVSELTWLRESAPAAVREFFRSGYPDMKRSEENIKIAERAGYKVLGTHTLPTEAWVDRYYDILEPRAQILADHTDASVRQFALETLKEIEVFRASEDSYGYVFYMLQRL
ncbi:MAG: class I SAM-dependent methyltransferase [Actinomycetota bacterium]